ncbi:hypothetical protein [Alteromonas sp. 009811495]|uniref:hypothetical protein n=1 Tax=Alteromonas sp. 009811495 TaxID=3002962 RepID=UPI00237D7D26|nr:hypothetical protein [Alteromonas sp. 009811495]WDT85387.1 hypothetical protein OZ660_15820 [Alteromonas sp. 009811495]
MKNISLFSLRSARLILITLLAITTAHTADAQVIFQEDKNNFIRLVEKPNETDSDMRANQHPFTLHERDITAILSGIQVVKNQNTSTPLFSNEQVSLLAAYLPEALITATAQQDVIFALSKEKRYLAGLKTQTYYVAGSIFVADNQLNILIGEFDKLANKAYEMAYDPTSQGLVKYDFDFGKRLQAKFSFNSPLSFSTPGIDLKTKNRFDWVVAPTQLAFEAPVEKEIFSLSNRENVPSKKDVSGPATLSKKNNIVDRFKRLNALKNLNLISETEYAEKRRQLLDEL